MPLTFSPEQLSPMGAVIIHELQGATYKDFMCTRCSTVYQRVKTDGARAFQERPCPRCGSTTVHLRHIPSSKRVAGSDIEIDKMAC